MRRAASLCSIGFALALLRHAQHGACFVAFLVAAGTRVQRPFIYSPTGTRQFINKFGDVGMEVLEL